MESLRHSESLPEKKSTYRRIAGILFTVLFLISFGFQMQSGAWRSDFGGHADEAAHVVTSLMVRDYLAGGFLETPHPMRYAESYYERFPKVAIGHYPPGFYLVASVGLLPFRSGGTFLVLMNLLNAGAGLLLYWFGRRMLRHDGQAAMIAFLYVALPQTRTYTAIVMADLLLVVLSLLAALSFLRFLQSGRARDSLLFGLWAAGAILTKGSGVGLALLPPFALLFSGKWRLLFAPGLWLAPVPVLLFALPWILFTMGITGEGMQESGLTEWVQSAVPFYGQAMVREVGWVGLAALAGAALLGGYRRVFRKNAASDGEAVLWSLLICGLVIALVVPAGLDNRYLMPVIPSVLLLGATNLRSLFPARNGKWQSLVVVLFAIVVLGETARPVQKLYTGASEAVRVVVGHESAEGGSGAPVRILVVSNATGEGAITAAAALALELPGLRVARGSKVLSSSDWLGRGYRVAFQTAEELFALLRNEGIGYIVIDEPIANSPEHWGRIKECLETTTDARVVWMGAVPSWRRTENRPFDVYRIKAD